MYLLDCDSSPIQSPLHPSSSKRLHTKDNGLLQDKLPSSLTPYKMRSPHHNEEPIKRYNPTLAYTRVHVFDLCSRKALCFRSIFPSSTSTPLMRLGHFTKFHPSCSTSRFALN
ncbi:hypothetical protein BHE74_00018845 [Ensete ventricosum]|nr:hypothetical protein BHE74_00018845 [Ensete ventricosum]